MSTDSRTLDCLLNGIEINCDPKNSDPACIRFSLDCLELIRHKMTAITAEGMSAASAYMEGRVGLAVVIDMRIRLWQYLDEHCRNSSISDHEVSSIRAVICVLHAQAHPDDKNIVDLLSFFLTLVNEVEPHFEEERALLYKHFAKCLEPQPSSADNDVNE